MFDSKTGRDSTHRGGRRFPRWGLYSVVAVWGAAVAAGHSVLFLYANTEGAAGRAPTVWPDESTIPRGSRGPTLVVFVHPFCSCSRATISELDRLMTRFRTKLDLRLMFYRPADAGPEWEQSDLWSLASRIPDAQLVADVDGVEADRFGAVTSGDTRLYSVDGRLKYHGGVTPARSHHGDSDGRSAILSHLAGADVKPSSAPVFGCRIFSRSMTAPDAGTASAETHP